MTGLGWVGLHIEGVNRCCQALLALQLGEQSGSIWYAAGTYAKVTDPLLLFDNRR